MPDTLETAVLPYQGPGKRPVVMALAALGVVYGDIGTSTLYGLKQAVEAGGAPTPETVMGIVSVILWSLILIVALKYAILILRADNHGEGGIVALLALLDARHAPRGSWRASLLIVGLIGAALLYGDGVITPAISVLSAVEGLKIDAPCAGADGRSHHHRDPARSVPGATQGNRFHRQHLRAGDAGVVHRDRPARPVRASCRRPGILAAISPHHAFIYLVHAGPGIAFAVLGAAFLALTGAEAMYADMGHFGRAAHPARMVRDRAAGSHAQLFRPGRTASGRPPCHREPVLPARAAMGALSDGGVCDGRHRHRVAIHHLRRVFPHPTGDPAWLPATHARTHTASHEKGQIYIPVVNWLLAAGTIAAVLLFGSSDALGGAYGIAVSMLMAVTTVLAALVALKWGYNPLLVAAVNGFFLVIELVFVAANMTKLIDGGWFPLLMAGVIAFLMLTWRSGWLLLEQQRSKLRQREDDFVAWVLETPPIRLSGAAAIFTAASTGIPLGLTHHLRHNRVLHERVLLVASIVTDEPRVAPERRIKLVPVCAGITRVLFYFGFMEAPDVMEGLKLACKQPELRGIDPRQYHLLFQARDGDPQPLRSQAWRSGANPCSPRCISMPTFQPRILAFQRPRSWRSVSKSRYRAKGRAWAGHRRRGPKSSRARALQQPPICTRARWCGLAPARQTAHHPREHYVVADPALFPGTEPDRERLGLPARPRFIETTLDARYIGRQNVTAPPRGNRGYRRVRCPFGLRDGGGCQAELTQQPRYSRGRLS